MVAPIHTRMPVLLQPQAERAWLASDTPLREVVFQFGI
jgi:putative SOS response-associated peptidase YedK